MSHACSPRARRPIAALLAALLAAATLCGGSSAWAQTRIEQAEEAIQESKYVRARELATAELRDRPESPRAEFVLALAYHEGEGNIPLALRHLDRARDLSENRIGFAKPGLERKHREILYHLMYALSDLGEYERVLEVTAQIRRLYDPDVQSVDIWPLMKLGRLDEARQAIERALDTERRIEHVIARNGACALDGYPECMRMLETVRGYQMHPGLALRNAASSALETGRWAEAEQLFLESTEYPSDDAHPWRDLAALYSAQGRLAEAVGAARRMTEVGQRFSARQRQYIRSEELVTGAQILLLLGRPDRALVGSERALAEPDRAAHWSGSFDEIQSQSVLLNRAIRRTLAERAAERAAASPWYGRIGPRLRSSWENLRGWLIGRRVVPLLTRGGLRPSSAIHPQRPEISGPLWLAMDAVQLFGAGPTLSLVDDVLARNEPSRNAIPPDLVEGQMRALECEARWLLGDERGVLRAGRRARELLPFAEVVARARVALRMADAAWRAGDDSTAWPLYAEVLERDPGGLRRLGLSLPVSLGLGETGPAQTAASRVMRSARFVRDSSSPFVLQASGAELCLSSRDGFRFGCSSEVTVDDSLLDAEQIAVRFLDVAFSPRVDLSQMDLANLDGTPITVRGARDRSVEQMLMSPE